MDRVLGLISFVFWTGSAISLVVGFVLNYKTARHLHRDSWIELAGFPISYFLLKDEVEKATDDSYLLNLFGKYRNTLKIFLCCVLGFFVCWFGGIVLMVVS